MSILAENHKIKVTGSGQLYHKRGKTEKEGAERREKKSEADGQESPE